MAHGLETINRMNGEAAEKAEKAALKPSPFAFFDRPGAKGAWIDNERFSVSLQVGMDGNVAYLGVQDKHHQDSRGHTLALGVRGDGRPFLQLVADGECKHVDLLQLIDRIEAFEKIITAASE